MARKKLGKLDEAGEDLRAVLKLEPSNKQAMSELSDIEKRQVGSNQSSYLQLLPFYLI